MKSTGIVRRIDDLGRVLIPKEIRRTMLLHDGDPVEFFMADGKTFAFRRYEPLGEVIKDEASFLIPAFKQAFGVDIIVVDDIGCVIDSTDRPFAGKRLTAPVPADTSAVTSVNFGEEDVPVSGCYPIVTNKTSFSEHNEGAVLIIGATDSGSRIAQTIAYAISQKIEEHF